MTESSRARAAAVALVGLLLPALAWAQSSQPTPKATNTVYGKIIPGSGCSITTPGVLDCSGTGSYTAPTLGSTLISSGATVPSIAALTLTASPNLGLRDTSAAFDVTLGATSSTALSAGRALTLDMKNVAHTLAFNATANTITFPNTSSFTVIGSADANTVTNAMAAQAALNTMKGNWTSGTANVADNTMPSCADSGGNHLNYVNGTGITCGTTGPSAVATTLATGTSVSLTAPREYYVCTSTCTVTPPVPSAGYEFCVLNDDNVATVITLAALGSSAMYENQARTAYGTAGTGTLVSAGAVGDKVCIVGRDATHYLTVSSTGTWTAN